ncbi:uncharacterized protein LOC124606035 [Schistocerca americana]|uniref:uncharacterized protein LOC124606035 n=1 Tax=Schistocerca americana TaxID=7009 RepID=UPI001F4F1FDF|nr:uncharacterized protein LOC124606035 [Schistocerca americana]
MTSGLFKMLVTTCGTLVHHMTSYHPPTNSTMERFHRTLKAALICQNTTWSTIIPVVLISLCGAHKADLGHIIKHQAVPTISRVPAFIQQLHHCMVHLYSISLWCHAEHWSLLYKDLHTCMHVMLQVDVNQPPLQPQYSTDVYCGPSHPVHITQCQDQTAIGIVSNIPVAQQQTCGTPTLRPCSTTSP